MPLPELNVDNRVATAGYYRLEWHMPARTESPNLLYELQESLDSHFHDASLSYQGPDLATVMSGRADGMRYYRVRAIRADRPVSQWSKTVSVETRHHSLSRAFGFFAVGAIVFVLTLVLVLRGGRHQREGDSLT